MNAIRAITVGKGIDPLEFAWVPFAGAGKMHAVTLAHELQIPRIIISDLPGTFSAWGMLQTDIRHDLVQTFYHQVAETRAEELEATYQEMEKAGAALLVEEKVEAKDMRFVRTADMRYVGQEYFVNISLPADLDDQALADPPDRFHRAYHERYGHSNPKETIEFVNLRMSAIGALPKSQVSATRGEIEASEAQPMRQGKAYFGGEWLGTGIFMRDELRSGQALFGPAIVLESSCTTVMLPGCRAEVDVFGNIEIHLDL